MDISPPFCRFALQDEKLEVITKIGRNSTQEKWRVVLPMKKQKLFCRVRYWKLYINHLQTQQLFDTA